MSNTTEVVFILDRSGSMARQESDVIGGFNAMVEQQRQKECPALVTTVLFSNRIHTLHDRVPLADVAPMTCADYCVGGSTALLDAIGETVRHIRKIHKYARPEDRPDRTLFVIMTDGLENASQHYNSSQIKRMVREQQEEAGWEFLFVGADIDAFAAAEGVGVLRSRTVQMSKTEDSYGGCFDAVGHIMYSYSMADSEDVLQDDDWNILMKAFDQKQKKQ